MKSEGQPDPKGLEQGWQSGVEVMLILFLKSVERSRLSESGDGNDYSMNNWYE